MNQAEYERHLLHIESNANKKRLELEARFDKAKTELEKQSKKDNSIAEMFGFNRILFTEKTLKERYNYKKINARKRNIKFDLSFESFAIVMSQPTCFYTGIPYQSAKEISLERVDNSKGYIEDNVVSCNGYINMLKGDFSLEEIGVLLKRKKIQHLATNFTTPLTEQQLRDIYSNTQMFLKRRPLDSFNPTI